MKILIVGLGLIGASYAMGLSNKHTVYGVDKNPLTIKKALSKGIIIDGDTDEKRFIPLVDLIILAIYPNDILDFLKTNEFLEGQIITDVTGVKCNFINNLPDIKAEFIGSHPMAGKEKSGIDFADNNIFKGANFLITKKNNNTVKAVNVLEDIANDLGFKNIKILTPEYHDEVIAFTSQLTHAIAVSLVNSDIDPETPYHTGDSYRDLTRIAAINENLWQELFFANKDNLLKMIDRFSVELNNIKNALINDDKDKLKELFISSTNKRKRF